MANINFTLRDPYKKGTSELVRQNKKKGKRVDNFFRQEEVPIIMVFGYDRKHRFKCKTDLKIKPREWDFKKQRMKSAITGSFEFNDRLDNLLKDVVEFYNGKIIKVPDITFKQVKEKITDFVKGQQMPDFEEGTGFFDVFKAYIEINKTKVSPRTIQKYNTLKKSLTEFTVAKKKYKNLTFSQIDMNFYDDYRNYLLTEVENPRRKDENGKSEKGLLNDTVAKYIENLKNFMKWSLQRGHHNNRHFEQKDFSSRRKPKHEIVTLTFEELKTFYEYDFSKDTRLERVRDLFCFACFTGQRWDDIAHFDKNDLEGDSWVFIARKPPHKKVVVPFLGYISPALNILKKYNYELPEITNQKFDEYIKEAAEVAELNRLVSLKRERGIEELIDQKPLHKFISMHTGRRTCVSLLLNVAKMPIPQVMDITQHSDFETLRKYINEDPEALRKNLKETSSVVDLKLNVVKRAN